MIPEIVDFHMHTTVSDGTDKPSEILNKVKEAGIEMFSVTDHDDYKGAAEIRKIISGSGISFINGIEFSCRDEEGKYHILGYGFDETREEFSSVVKKAHKIRLDKVHYRLDYLKKAFGFDFSDEDIEALFKNSNPGKPHIAKLMIKYGYAKTINDAMKDYLNKKKFPNAYITPDEAIEAVIKGGGIPVLAHPSYGDGDQLIIGDDMRNRLLRLLDMGVMGLEAYYSGFTLRLQKEILSLADEFDLYVTAGSDYHGKNKIVTLGDTNLNTVSEGSPRLTAFIEKMYDIGAVAE